MSDEFVEIAGNGADVLRDAPLVVVQDGDKTLGSVRQVVQCLKGNAVGQCGVADDGHHVFIAAAPVTRGANSERSRKSGARMSGAVAVMLALGTHRKAAQAPRAADRAKAVPPVGQQFVHIDLMAYVPDKFVLRRVEDVMQRDGQLDHAQIRAEVAAIPGQALDEFQANLFRQLLKLLQCQFLDLRRRAHHFKISAHKKSWSDGKMECCNVRTLDCKQILISAQNSRRRAEASVSSRRRRSFRVVEASLQRRPIYPGRFWPGACLPHTLSAAFPKAALRIPSPRRWPPASSTPLQRGGSRLWRGCRAPRFLEHLAQRKN